MCGGEITILGANPLKSMNAAVVFTIHGSIEEIGKKVGGDLGIVNK